MIDLDHLARQTAGNTALQQELLGLLLTQIEDVRRMIEGAAPVDPMALTEVFHRLRGAAVAVGALSLASSLSQAETSLESATSSPDVVAALQPALRNAQSDVSRLLPR